MDKHVRRLMIGLSLPVLAAVLVEQMPKKGMVKVPFPFQVEGRTLPAGAYSVRRSGTENGIRIQNQQAPESSVELAATSRKYGKADGAKLVFRCYGDRYFLSEIWFSADSAGLVVSPSPLDFDPAAGQPEREVAAIHFE